MKHSYLKGLVMRPELVVLALSVLAFIVVIFGVANLFSVKYFKDQREEAERIFRQRILSDNDEKVRLELMIFFRKAERSIFISVLSFASAFVLFTMVIKKLYPSDSIPKTILSLAILLIMFGVPFAASMLVSKDLSCLKSEIMERFNEQQ